MMRTSRYIGFIACFSIAITMAFALPASIHTAHAETEAEKEVRLQRELAQVEAEQRQTEQELAAAQGESASLDRDIKILNAKIKTAQLNIQAKNLLIESLGKDINAKTSKIGDLNERIERGQQSLAQIMRKTHEIDSYTLPEVLLAGDDISTFFSDIDSFESVKQSLYDTFDDIREARAQTETERAVLDTKKNQETDARAVIAAEKKAIEKAEVEKKTLLNISKGNEKAYAQVLSEKRAKAAQIRAALFALRDTAAIPFDKALQYANEASRATGVRPAFILAILTQESALGKNVGTCYLTDPKTGAGVSTKSGTTFKNLMKATRDVEPFLDITKELGLDPYKTLVSCPQSIGYGGAMGPAQFIPSTWKLLISRLKVALNVAVPNPWEPQHAFMASAMYLADLGAKGGTYTAERNAACRYYSGKICTAGNINTTYGNQVVAKATNIQETMINPLQGL